MKKLNSSQPLSVTTIYRPLSLSLKIKAEDGMTTSQFYYQSTMEWMPDHTKSPVYDENGVQKDGLLRLRADYFIQDEDNLIDTSKISPTIYWYVNDKQISVTSSSNDYYIQDKTLCVKKNLSYLDSATVVCEVHITDPRNSQPIVISDTLVLNAVLMAKDAWQIMLLCDRTRKHYPLHAKTTIYDFEAEVREGAILRNDTVKWFWDYSTDNGGTFKDVTPDCLWYVSGLGTNKLSIDIDFIESITVRCRIGSDKSKTSPDLPNEATASMMWRIPNLRIEVFSYGGNRILPENASMRFGFFVHIPKHDDMTMEEKKHWLLTSWEVRRQGSASSPVVLNEHGMEVDIAQQFLTNNALGKFIADPNIGIRGVYDVVSTSEGHEIELSNGHTFAIRT